MVRYDRFYTYEELTATLREWADAHPKLVALESIGTSHEGREIWLATVTSTETGPHDEKPAILVEANIHSVEVTGCTAALHLLERLVTGYGSDEQVTRALDTRTFYVVPRLNPDGAELALAERPRYVRSSVRAYPLPEPEDGLHREDVDGDGRILSMRLRDDSGNWKPHPEEPALMVRRDPDEFGGDYYRVLPEGTVKNYDGVQIKIPPPVESLDLNRNFPGEWGPEADQRGAGPYPTSEPEVRAMVEAVFARPNVCCHVAYHTFSGVHLRPYASDPDDRFPTGDLRAYKQMGDVATGLTGYPSISVFHEFAYDPKSAIRGSAHDFLYEQRGIFSWTTEFWSPQRQAGITDYKYIEWIRDHPPEDDLKLYRWAREKLGNHGYVDWTPFEHPQLGPVEIGGWDQFYAWYNVPFEQLEAEIAPHTEWALFQCLISPRLEQRALDVERVGEGVWRVQLVLENTGWLPTNVSDKALERKAVRDVEITLELPDGARLVAGDAVTKAGQLEGRVHKRSILWFTTNDATTDRAKVEWVIEAPEGSEVGVVASHQRAGTVRATAQLGGETTA
jgi:murein tripeptide amidase MpaA